MGGFSGVVAGPDSLSNPDLLGGMEWLVIFVMGATGVIVGGSFGIRMGKRRLLIWLSMSQISDDLDGRPSTDKYFCFEFHSTYPTVKFRHTWCLTESF